jgi:hypothetical protein
MADEPAPPNRVHLLEQLREQFIGGDAMMAAVSDMLSLFSFNSSVQLILLVTKPMPKEQRMKIIDRVVTVWKRALLSQNTKAAQAHQELLTSVKDREHLSWALPDSEDSRVGFMKAVKVAEKRIRDAFEYGMSLEDQADAY